MKKVDNAKNIVLKSFSMWANYLGLAALVLPELIYWIWQIDTNPRIWWIIGIVLILAGSIGRLINQNITRTPGSVMALALIMGMSLLPSWMQNDVQVSEASQNTSSYTQTEFNEVALPLIGKWEGLRTKAYKDIVGVWTVCYGETKGVRPGDSYTKSQCRDMLAREVLDYRKRWHAYLTQETIQHRLHASRDAAFTSLAYNVGVSAAGKSTATRRLNNGNIEGACQAISWWNKAGQRVIRGLVNRRAEEVSLCLIGSA